MIEATIKGVQEAQKKNLKAIAALSPKGVGKALQIGSANAHRYAVSITHIDTGTLRAAHRIELNLKSARARLFIDPGATNPDSGEKAAEYGVYEHRRGGEHAFYERTEREIGDKVADLMARVVVREMP